MRLGRLLRHFLLPDWWVLRAFPKSVLKSIEQAVAASEHRHLGELRFVVEANLPVHGLLHNQSTRERAIELFSLLRIWDTEHNSGVLIYVQLIDRGVEIVADRGVVNAVDKEFWAAVCRRMEAAFRLGKFEAGTLDALSEITENLARHFPASGDNSNELPDSPLIR